MKRLRLKVRTGVIYYGHYFIKKMKREIVDLDVMWTWLSRLRHDLKPDYLSSTPRIHKTEIGMTPPSCPLTTTSS